MSDAEDAQPKADGLPADYEVGYRKPPDAFRYKKGGSGNPKGRPRTSQDLHWHHGHCVR